MDFSIITLLAIVTICGIIFYLIAWFITKSNYQTKLASINEQLTAATQNYQQLKADFIAEQQNKTNALRELSATTQKLEHFNALETRLKTLETDKAILNEQNIQTSERNKYLNKKLIEQKEEIEQLNEKFKKEFENLANKILEEKTEKFKQQNHEQLNQILNPFTEAIKQFKQKVEDSDLKSANRHGALRQQLEQLGNLNQQMQQETQNLTKALKGDTQKQGAWGEMILEKVLETSGLQKGREYEIQKTVVDEHGNRPRPDVVVYLPQNKKIVIDSKVSLTHYERFVNAKNETEKQTYLKAHLNSIKQHIKGLSAKSYQDLFPNESLDFVLLFIPIESAFSLAIETDLSLYSDAFTKKIVIVTPSTLLATLKTIDNIWDNEKQHKNVLEIANRAGKMYDKFVGFTENMQKIGERMNQTQKEYNLAMNKLSEGRGNLVNSAENIKKLGAKTKNSLPQNLINNTTDNPTN